MTRSSRNIADLVRTSETLAREVDELAFGSPVSHVYNPLVYAFEPHRAYLERYAARGASAILLGMNPGPFGMAQTGVPFGEVTLVRDWLEIRGQVTKPRREHPKRPIEGLACQRSEVSGQRLWGWAKQRFERPEAFFQKFFVINYCPLAFMAESGRNLTPDKLPLDERQALFAVCDRALQQMIAILSPRLVVGIGKFAEQRAKESLADLGVPIAGLLHPSPASPAANRGWSALAEKKLNELGVL